MPAKKEAEKPKETPKPATKIGMLSILGFAFGGLFILAGISTLTTSIAAGIFFILAGIVIIPLFNRWLHSKFNVILSVWLRVIISFMLLVFAGIFLGPAMPTQSAEQQTQKQYAFGDKIEFGNMRLAVSPAGKGKLLSDPDKRARTGALFYVFSVKVENTGKQAISFGNGNLKLFDPENRQFDVGGCQDKEKGQYAIGESIEPGLSAEFINCYSEIPESVKSLILEIKDNPFFGSNIKMGFPPSAFKLLPSPSPKPSESPPQSITINGKVTVTAFPSIPQ